MRESTVFLIGMICFITGSSLGVFIHYLMAERHIAALNETLLKDVDIIARKNKVIRRLIQENNRLQVEKTKCSIKWSASAPIKGVKIITPDKGMVDAKEFFMDVINEPLPDHFADDIDFGGKF